ncbi:hypothetical protein ACFL0B_00150 [Thermodesulfobacteriota bacterium]
MSGQSTIILFQPNQAAGEATILHQLLLLKQQDVIGSHWADFGHFLFFTSTLSGARHFILDPSPTRTAHPRSEKSLLRDEVFYMDSKTTSMLLHGRSGTGC